MKIIFPIKNDFKKNNLKFTIIPLLVFLFTSITAGQTIDTLWSENWEGNWINDWTVDAGIWEVGTPTAGPSSAYKGENCAGTVLGGNYPENADTRLIRQTQFKVPPASQNPRLRFWHWFDIGNYDYGEVQIKTISDEWKTISNQFVNTSGGIWSPYTVQLDGYADSLVQIAFYFHAQPFYESSGWYIDNIEVFSETPTDVNKSKEIPHKFELLQNYPNPFNPSTKIKYSIPKTTFVKLKIFNVLGNEITTLVNEEKHPGNYEIEFNASKYNLTSGVYLYRIETSSFSDTKKLLLLK